MLFNLIGSKIFRYATLNITECKSRTIRQKVSEKKCFFVEINLKILQANDGSKYKVNYS